MNDLTIHTQALLDQGFSVIENIYSANEVQHILTIINNADRSKETFRKSTDLFAIRQFLKELPACFDPLFNERLRNIIRQVMGEQFFVVKSIYFDKPANSNWYVSYHQDLTISVDRKIALEHFGPWTTKQNQFAVQPPTTLLENITTIGIHLDDTDENNGALNVIPGSHLKKIYRPETIPWNYEEAVTCPVGMGGIMCMKPLI